MSLDLSKKIASNLKKINYKGRLSFSGFGEPFLAKNFFEHLKIYRSSLEKNNLETNTNGDKLTPQLIQKAFEAGLTNLYINAYDGEHQISEYEKIIEDSKIDKKRFFIRPHWEGYQRIGFIFK